MNIAFGAVIIVALLYPGILFRLLYLRGVDLIAVFRSADQGQLKKNRIQYYRDVSKSKFRIFGQAVWEQVIASLLPALVVHTLTIQLVSGFGRWYRHLPDYGLLYRILVADKLTDQAVGQLADSVPRFVGYFFAMLLVAGVLGIVSRQVVRRFYVDLSIKMLRFSSDWDYLLSGRVLGKSEQTLDVVWIHVLSETKEQSIIYDGFLWDYELSDSNGLDKIILFNVSKRSVHKQIRGFKHQQTGKLMSPAGEESVNREEFSYHDVEEIDEQLIVFPYSQVKNLTITYVDLNEVSAATEP